MTRSYGENHWGTAARKPENWSQLCAAWDKPGEWALEVARYRAQLERDRKEAA